MARRYRMPAGCDPELWALVKPLRVAMSEQGLSQVQLGMRLGCDRSRVSRALSAREMPPRHLIVQIAQMLGADVAAVQRRS
jgi:transcriptional regulator with XRE-family HTH domain